MNDHNLNRDHDLIRTLKTLDIAPHSEIDETSRRRAEARKEQILATPVLAQVSTRSSRPRRRWPFAVAGIAAIAVVGLIAADTFRPVPAYASWTAGPTTVTAKEQAIAGAACINQARTPGADVVLAERRGEWIGVAAVTENFLTATCIVYFPVAASRAGEVLSATSGGQGAVPTGGEFTDGSISTFSGGGVFGLRTSPPVAFNIGDVGDDVAAVDITTPDGEVVHATVDDGRFIAWWPGTAFGDATEGNGGPAPDLQYSITLDDGTTTHNAEPVRPE